MLKFFDIQGFPWPVQNQEDTIHRWKGRCREATCLPVFDIPSLGCPPPVLVRVQSPPLYTPYCPTQGRYVPQGPAQNNVWMIIVTCSFRLSATGQWKVFLVMQAFNWERTNFQQFLVYLIRNGNRCLDFCACAFMLLWISGDTVPKANNSQNLFGKFLRPNFSTVLY